MIAIYDSPNKISEERNWKFNRRNVNRIAVDNAAEVIDFDKNGRATLKDDMGRLFWIYKVAGTPWSQ